MMVVMTHEPGQMHSKLARLGWVLVAASLGWLTRKYNGWIWRLQAVFPLPVRIYMSMCIGFS
jgi:hypothetical protein